MGFEDVLAQVQSRYNPFSYLDLPDWVVKYRSNQLRAIEEITSAFQEVNLVVLDAPTGSGKTLIAETVRQILETSGVYMCTTKTLQDQVVRDFPYGNVVKGRANYPTELYPERFGSSWNSLNCSDCVKREEYIETDDGEEIVKRCEWCSRESNCPYEIAKIDALYGELAILNTSYFLTECNGPGRFAGRGLVVADECDLLEHELMRFVSISISERKMKQYGIEAPVFITKEESWREWLDENIPKIKAIQSSYPHGSLQAIRESKYLRNLYEKLVVVRKGMESEDQKWIYTGSKDRVEWKPVLVDSLGEKMLWKWGKRWLIMSGTVISAQELLDSLGWKEDYGVVEVGSGFDPERRRVRIKPLATMSKGWQDNGEGEKVVKGIEMVLKRQEIGESPMSPVLIHTVSFDLARFLAGKVNTKRLKLAYYGGDDRNGVFEKFLDGQKENPVLFAASMDRGVDLAEELCRVQVVAKVPFPYLGDKQVNTRLRGTRGGQVWYSVQTIRTIIQMCGRVVRSEEDWGETWILDRQFGKLFGQYRHLFPEWWREGLIWER